MVNIVFQFLVWYFWDVPKKILLIWKNFLKFNLEYFSIFLLLKTFFAPWRDYRWDYGRGFDLARYAETLFSNLITRIIGAIVRSFLIAIGLAVEIFIILIGGVIFISWFLLPMLLWEGFMIGLSFIFHLQ